MSFRLATALLLSLASPIHAAPTDGVRCVQAQLSAAGYDTGALDGVIGRATREAQAAFAKARNLPTGLPFHRESAISYCRRIGLADPALRAFWPSAKTALDIQIDPAVQVAVGKVTEAALREIYPKASERLGLALAGTDTVVIATTPQALRAMITRSVDYDIIGLDATLKDICSSVRNISGNTAPGILYICTRPGARLGDDIGSTGSAS